LFKYRPIPYGSSQISSLIPRNRKSQFVNPFAIFVQNKRSGE
jgi:hypothetical protein